MHEDYSFEKLEAAIKSYNPTADLNLVRRAYDFALSAHGDQKRASGESYFVHPFNVAMLLAGMHLDTTSIAAGLLHDCVEDTSVTIEEITEKFGRTIGLIVEGVTKISKLQFKSTAEQQAQSLRKMLFAMVKDIRVILVKLADRLHNMRTVSFLPEDKQKRIARETLEIYAPLANRLGMYAIKSELEDISFSIVEPEEYNNIKKTLEEDSHSREQYINEIVSRLQGECRQANIEAQIFGRPKHIYSIYQKMRKHEVPLSQIYDRTGIRVLVNTVTDCYTVLGIVHNLWRPIPGRFKDYIAMPKPNMYQSLHTTIIHPRGEPVEIQIRTHLMNRVAEEGIAAHWNYKENSKTSEEVRREVQWLRQLVNWHRDVTDAREFIETIKIDLYRDEVFVFTPQGDVKVCPVNATPLDFAYSVHTEIGHHCVGAKVNGKMVPLNTTLQTGDIVEIITSPNARPSNDWLNIVRSSHARSKIKAYFKNMERAEDLRKGREIMNEAHKDFKKELIAFLGDFNGAPVTRDELNNAGKFFKTQFFQDTVKALEFKAIDDFFVAVGRCEIMPRQVYAKMFPKWAEQTSGKRKEPSCEKPKPVEKKKKKSIQGIIVDDLDDVLVRFAHCCNPIPGDSIVGFITRGRGITVHRSDCKNLNLTPEEASRKINVQWDNEKIQSRDLKYSTRVRIEVQDRPNMIADITSLISSLKLNIYELHARTVGANQGIIDFILEVKNKTELDTFLQRVKTIEGVSTVTRSNI